MLPLDIIGVLGSQIAGPGVNFSLEDESSPEGRRSVIPMIEVEQADVPTIPEGVEIDPEFVVAKVA
jgi:hypothetical protein